MSLMAASGDYPDILPTRGTDVFYQAGALLQLDELIDKYGPNIKKLYGDKLGMARWSEEDPHIYSFHWLKLNQRRFTPDGSPFAIQLDVLRELGYPEIKTLQQYEDAIRTYKQNHPTIDGQPTIGLSLCGGDTLMFILSVTNPAFFATGAPDDGEWYIDPETGKPQLHITRPVEKEYFRWLNHMYAEGLLDEESFVQKKDQYVSKIASGRVLATINGVWAYADATKVLRREGKEWRTMGIVPVAMEGYENSNNWKNWGGGDIKRGYGVSKKCKNPEAFVKFVDYYVSEEGQILVNWGIEGEHYKVENGKRVVLPEVAKQKAEDPDFRYKTGIGILTDILPGYGEGVVDSTGNYYVPVGPEDIRKEYSEAEKEVLSHYGKQIWIEMYKMDFPQSKRISVGNNPFPQGSEEQVILQKASELIRLYVPRAVMAKPSDFDKVWDEFMKELNNLGIQKVYEAYEREMHKRYKLWGWE
jgi:putative aldouronate transport system substrate-binding protein